jgi:histidinol-phosphate aminotransferase
VAQALAAVAPTASIYPDPLQRDVRQALAAYTGAPADQIVAGAGCDEIIDLVLRILVGVGDEVIDLTPTFGMFSVTTRIVGGQVVSVPRDESFEVDLEAVRRAVGANTKAIFVCNPNNPTGNLSPESYIRELLALGPMVVVDETYHEFSGFTVAPLVSEHDNLVVMRTLSKWAGLAGLRVGYGIMPPRLAEYMMAVKTPYNISVAAQAALLATLEDTDLLLQRVRTIVEERERMGSLLEQMPGVRCLPSRANFLLCRFPPGRAYGLQSELAGRGIFVRYFSSPRLRDYLRITAGKPEQTDAVLAALRELLER